MLNPADNPSVQSLPVIDVSVFADVADTPARKLTAEQIRKACRSTGFFYATGHGIPPHAFSNLLEASQAFFALPEATKLKIAMPHAGKAWRGYFPLGGELTSGQPDLKEGVYFGTHLTADDARVASGLPMHGANLYPDDVPELRPAVDTYMAHASAAGFLILRGIALALDLDADYFQRDLCRDPTLLFRVFHYPAAKPDELHWGVGEHTDYGLLTLLATDGVPGLEVRTPDGWIEAPPIAGTLICNIGDMLDRLTGGWFKSTPHRVRNTSGRSRISFPLFFDPSFDSQIHPLPGSALRDDSETRWDKSNVHAFSGTYGDYLIGKVGKVFPELQSEIQ